MRTMSAALLAFLNTTTQIVSIDLFTFELKSGVTMRYCSNRVAVTFGGLTWLPAPAGLTRSRIRWVTGVEVDTMDIEFQADPSITVGGVPMLAAARLGLFDNARITLSRLFMTDFVTPVDILDLFQGSTAPAQIYRTALQLSVKSALEGLNVQIPPDVFQPSCLNTLFDPACGVNSATYRAAGVVGTVGSDGGLHTALGQANGWFETGSVKFTSGANTGFTRTVKTYVGGVVYVTNPFPYPVGGGDSFLITPGCDHKHNGDCLLKFNNVVRFKGMPFVPVPETAA